MNPCCRNGETGVFGVVGLASEAAKDCSIIVWLTLLVPTIMHSPLLRLTPAPARLYLVERGQVICVYYGCWEGVGYQVKA